MQRARQGSPLGLEAKGPRPGRQTGLINIIINGALIRDVPDSNF